MISEALKINSTLTELNLKSDLRFYVYMSFVLFLLSNGMIR